MIQPRGQARPCKNSGVAGPSVELLQRIPLFAELEPRELERLSGSFKERTFDAGQTVATEGEGGAGFFVIESGEATVTVRDADRGKLGPGDYFGEIALIDEGARSATITASEIAMSTRLNITAASGFVCSNW